jgi:hypothetical protein
MRMVDLNGERPVHAQTKFNYVKRQHIDPSGALLTEMLSGIRATTKSRTIFSGES